MVSCAARSSRWALAAGWTRTPLTLRFDLTDLLTLVVEGTEFTLVFRSQTTGCPEGVF